MAAEIFTALSNLRMILDTETDADSPNSETLNKAYRYAIEAILMLAFGTAGSGSATSDPSNDADGFFYDTAAGWTDDQHNGRTLVITSGSAKGNMYTIDDTVDADDKVACTGDNLYSDGVRSGDDYIILYDIKTNSDGHDHDGVNSKMAVMPLGRTVVACDGAGAATTESAWATHFNFSVYVPENPSTLRMYAFLYTENAAETCVMRFVLTDSASTVFTSDSASTSSTSAVKKSVSADCSAAAAGHAQLQVQTSSSGGSYLAYIFAITAIWDT